MDQRAKRLLTYGGFLSHAGTPMAGWFISWKIPNKQWWCRSTPMTLETFILALYQRVQMSTASPQKQILQGNVAMTSTATGLHWIYPCSASWVSVPTLCECKKWTALSICHTCHGLIATIDVHMRCPLLSYWWGTKGRFWSLWVSLCPQHYREAMMQFWQHVLFSKQRERGSTKSVC